jgi:hypothetical protein
LKTLTDAESPFEVDDLKLTACFGKPWINPMTEAGGGNGAISIKRDCECAQRFELMLLGAPLLKWLAEDVCNRQRAKEAEETNQGRSSIKHG